MLSVTDCISFSDFSRADIDLVLKTALELERTPEREKINRLSGKTVALAFFEPSTRTKLSFHMAAKRMGCHTIGFSSAHASSSAKGESLMDTIRILSGYADLIVIRHPLEGSARLAAEISACPVLNAGDGANQHPTQGLLDLYSIQKECGRLDNLHIGIVGDLKNGRTMHSLLEGLSHFSNNTVHLIAHPLLQLPDERIRGLPGHGLHIEKTERLDKILPHLDVLYVTRVQKERFADPLEYERVRDAFVITPSLVAKGKTGLRVFHPLPRVNEIDPQIDALPQAAYFRQAKNGVVVREALLGLLSKVKK